ncbi:MAG: hypothetical protein K6A69_04335 [Lachnospiraceae bacterium]|nr:hypothetical protein [Lachnospiraceae bacterium]
MKKKVLSVFLAMGMAISMLSGCGGAATDDALDKAEEETVSDASEDAVTEPQKSESTGDSKSDSDLYELFKGGEVKAVYTGAADKAEYVSPGNVLSVGSAYDINEIIDLISSGDEYMEMHVSSDPMYRMIDCGSDGEPELLVSVEFEGPEIFTLFLVIKEIDGELNIIYDADMWSRSETIINDDGTIETGGSGGAAIHYSSDAFIDKDGNYKFYYGVETEYCPLEFYVDRNGSFEPISFEGTDTDHLVVYTYSTEAAGGDTTYYYSYGVLDDNFNEITTEADFSDDNAYKQVFMNAGIDVYSKSEIDSILSNKATEIGYPL